VAGEEARMDGQNPLRVLLEGRPGIGKTTVTRCLVALLRDAGVQLGGFVTDEIRVCGRYGVDPPTFERIALPALAAPEPGGVIVVDELGRMELASAAFRDSVSDLLGRDVAVVATVQRDHHPFIDALKRRPDVGVVRIAEPTRDALPKQLAAQLRLVGVRGRAR
jgi:nucleoside-triphosphatase